uniref:EGF-like domain-containing protein n=1 Tax=Parastrongyloides trichosuri TaxID=131310 RepID=A0A0N4Z6C0_PARTI
KGFTFKSSSECYAPNGPTNRNKKYTEYVKFSEQCAPNIEDITSLILRMIGLINPINRPDRNNYVMVNTRKMMSKDRKLTNPFNFKEVELYNTSFDFSSLALYKQYKIGNALGIASKIPSINNVTDNRYEPSFNDYKMLNQIYCSNIVIENKTVCENGGYNYPRFPYHCVCPDYYDGDNCSFIKKSDESCSKYIQTTLNSTINRVGVLFHGSNACYQEIFSPTGRNVSIHIDTVYMKTSLCTKDNGVEVKFLPDLGASGLRLCGHHRNIQLYSNATKMLVAFNGKNIFDHILVTF